jgi:hypothetical protein
MHSDADKANADLVGRLRVKAAMLRLGERIAFGSDADALEGAADAIEALLHRNRQLSCPQPGWLPDQWLGYGKVD